MMTVTEALAQSVNTYTISERAAFIMGYLYHNTDPAPPIIDKLTIDEEAAFCDGYVAAWAQS